MPAPLMQDAARLTILANTISPSLIILTRKQVRPGSDLIPNCPQVAYTYAEANELLARWAETAPAPEHFGDTFHRVEVQIFFGPAVGSKGNADEVIDLSVRLKASHTDGYDLRLHFKRFAAYIGGKARVG